MTLGGKKKKKITSLTFNKARLDGIKPLNEHLPSDVSSHQNTKREEEYKRLPGRTSETAKPQAEDVLES